MYHLFRFCNGYKERAPVNGKPTHHAVKNEENVKEGRYREHSMQTLIVFKLHYSSVIKWLDSLCVFDQMYRRH